VEKGVENRNVLLANEAYKNERYAEFDVNEFGCFDVNEFGCFDVNEFGCFDVNEFGCFVKARRIYAKLCSIHRSFDFQIWILHNRCFSILSN